MQHWHGWADSQALTIDYGVYQLRKDMTDGQRYCWGIYDWSNSFVAGPFVDSDAAIAFLSSRGIKPPN